MQSLVSIIIPTYNRAHLIGGTLDSARAQTYQNWECIIVDDGSNDYTDEMMEFYCERDSRIQYHHRPKERLKGANACRNYGFEISRGRYINWFDSDDLMVPEFIERKVSYLQNFPIDYVISKTINFQDPEPSTVLDKNEYFYRFDKHEINHFNYLTQNINWLTYDFMCKNEIVAGIRFNEILNSAQERNFFSKLTCKNINAMVINEYLTLRRVHPYSIQSGLAVNPHLKIKESFLFFYLTWGDLKMMDCKSSLPYLFTEAVKKTLVSKIPIKFLIQLEFEFLKQRKYTSALWFFYYQVSKFFFNRGHYFREKFKLAFGIN